MGIDSKRTNSHFFPKTQKGKRKMDLPIDSKKINDPYDPPLKKTENG